MNEDNMYCRTCNEDIYQSTYDNKWYIRIENMNWDEYNDSLDYTEIPINYCYSCGKKYE